MTGLAAGLACLAGGWVAALVARRTQARFLARPKADVGVHTASADHPVPSDAAVAARVGGFEAWRLVIHPVFLVGLGLVAILFFGPASGRLDLEGAAQDGGVYLVPFAWGAMIAANLGALRARRHGVEELCRSLPATAATRTAGHLLSGFVALAAGSVLLALALANEVLFRDAYGTPNLGMLTVGPLIVLGGCVLGVLTARWAPSAIVGVLLVIGTFAVEGVAGSSGTSPARWLQFWVQVVAEDGGHPFPGPSDWHVLYLVGLVGIGATVGVARHGLTRGVAGLGVVALAAAGIAGIAQTRQPSAAEVRRQAAVFTRAPEACEERAAIRYCVTSEKDRDRFDDIERSVQGVLARVPGPVRNAPLVVSERRTKIVSNSNCTPTPAIELLSPLVRPHVSPQEAWPADNEVHPVPGGWDSECNLNDHGIVLTLQVGSWAVGLPPTQAGTSPPCRADGQARSVLALWLAGQSHPRAPEAIRDVLAQSRELGLGAAVGFNWATWPNWGVAWADADLALALVLLERPEGDMARIVTDHWADLADPGTPSSRFAALAGVEPQVSRAPTVVAEHSHSLEPAIRLTDRLMAQGLPACP